MIKIFLVVLDHLLLSNWCLCRFCVPLVQKSYICDPGLRAIIFKRNLLNWQNLFNIKGNYMKHTSTVRKKVSNLFTQISNNNFLSTKLPLNFGLYSGYQINVRLMHLPYKLIKQSKTQLKVKQRLIVFSFFLIVCTTQILLRHQFIIYGGTPIAIRSKNRLCLYFD